MSTTIEQDIIKQEASNFDVKFIFENGQQIGGRVAMLEAKSPVFEAMFKGSMTRQVNIKAQLPSKTRGVVDSKNSSYTPEILW